MTTTLPRARTEGQARELPAEATGAGSHSPSSSSTKPLLPIPDDEDRRLTARNTEPDFFAKGLRAMVPLLESVDFKILRLDSSKSVASIAFTGLAVNQLGTVQASIFYLLADYAAGIGVVANLPGISVMGLHDPSETQPVQMWTKEVWVEHVAPATGPVRGESSISPVDIDVLRRELVTAGRGSITCEVTMLQDDRVVARGRVAFKIRSVLPKTSGQSAEKRGPEPRAGAAFLIAGTRGDPISKEIAGAEGAAIAKRFAETLPQAPSMIRARSADAERVLRDPARRFEQVVVLGVGLDYKPIAFSSASQRWFGVDRPPMLELRARRESRCPGQAASFQPVPADLSCAGWERALVESGFAPEKATLFFLEGVSMYLPPPCLSSLLEAVARLARSPESRLWVDHVGEDLLTSDIPEVVGFLGGMRAMGEPFVNGFRDASKLSSSWACEERRSADQVAGVSEPVHARYFFSLLRPTRS